MENAGRIIRTLGFAPAHDEESILEIKATEGLAGVLRTLGQYDKSMAMYEAVTRLQHEAGNLAGERWSIVVH